MRKHPEKRPMLGVGWTKWFMPKLAFAAMYRKFGWEPTMFQSKERLRIYNKMTLVYMATCWTIFGYFLYQFMEGKHRQTDALDDLPQAVQLAAKSDRTFESVMDDKAPQKIVHITLQGLTLKREDITEQVKQAGLKARGHSPDYDKYKDPEYLAKRANMDENDPKFDPEYLAMYFRRVDSSGQSQSQGKFRNMLFGTYKDSD